MCVCVLYIITIKDYNENLIKLFFGVFFFFVSVPISMPESVQNKTNEDLKRVLNIKSTTSDNDSSEEDGANLSNMVPM